MQLVCTKELLVEFYGTFICLSAENGPVQPAMDARLSQEPCAEGRPEAGCSCTHQGYVTMETWENGQQRYKIVLLMKGIYLRYFLLYLVPARCAIVN